MLLIRWLCIWFFIVSTVSCEFLRKSSFFTDSKSSNEVILCVENIASEFFTWKENVLIISDDSNFVTGPMLRRIEPNFGISLVNKNSWIDFTAIHDFIVIQDESTKDPYLAVENMIINPRGRYVIVTGAKPEVLEISAARFWRAGISNVIFLHTSDDGPLTVFGYKISPLYQNFTRLLVLDICKGKFEKWSNLFPSKFRDMNGYPLKVTVLNTQQVEPEIYVIRENGELKINGVGSSLVNVFAEKLNFKVLVKENSYYGHKEKDGTWVGPPAQLIRGEADLSFAAIFPSPRIIQDLEYSDYYEWGSFHFAMKIKGRTVSWKSVFKPLSFEVWFGQLLVLLATLCLVWVVKKFWSMDMLKEYVKYIDLLKVLLNQGVRYPKFNGIRLAFALWLVYAYLMSTAYTGSLVNYLSMPNYGRNPNTVEELEKSTLEIGGPIPIKLLLGETGDPVEKRIHDRFANLTIGNFWSLLAEKDRAVVVYRISAMLHNWKTRQNESMRIHILEDPIIGFPLFYYMRKGHPYMEPLNHFIRKIQSSGLITKWMADYNAVKLEIKNEQESVVLTLEHLGGVFLILLCGYVISIVGFFYELYNF